MTTLIIPNWILYVLFVGFMLDAIRIIQNFFYVRKMKRKFEEVKTEITVISNEAQTKSNEGVALQLKSITHSNELIDVTKSIMLILQHEEFTDGEKADRINLQLVTIREIMKVYDKQN